MPAKNSLKLYAPESFYHIYNRGVEKRNIFIDNQDYAVFLNYLSTYLLPKDTNHLNQIIASSETSTRDKEQAIKTVHLRNFAGEIELHCFALLPNHFHFLIKQSLANSIDRFMNCIGTRYTMYFNKKYQRVGKLYQGVYKAVMVNTDEQLLHLSRYIHLNPFVWHNVPVSLNHLTTFYSSLSEYAAKRQTAWIHNEQILSYFQKGNQQEDYFSFVKKYANPEIVVPIALDFEE